MDVALFSTFSFTAAPNRNNIGSYMESVPHEPKYYIIYLLREACGHITLKTRVVHDGKT